MKSNNTQRISVKIPESKCSLIWHVQSIPEKNLTREVKQTEIASYAWHLEKNLFSHILLSLRLGQFPRKATKHETAEKQSHARGKCHLL